MCFVSTRPPIIISEGTRGLRKLRCTQVWPRALHARALVLDAQRPAPKIRAKLDDVFSRLALGIKYQVHERAALGQTWVHRSFLILGFLSLMIIGGLVLTKHNRQQRNGMPA